MAQKYDLDLSLGAREFVGTQGLQPANQGQPNVKPASRANELMTPITTGNGSKTITSVSSSITTDASHPDSVSQP